jgi:hypothetical protein
MGVATRLATRRTTRALRVSQPRFHCAVICVIHSGVAGGETPAGVKLQVEED